MKNYERMSHGENLDWCRPYISDDERIAVAVNEGEIINIQVDGRDIEWDEKRKFSFGYSENLLHRLAQEINPNYDLYKGYTDTHIILDTLEERGCAECPWRDECDAMLTDED